MNVDPIWFDSMGAKSTCTKVVTEDTSILIDPGSAAMQPSYPISDNEKLFLRQKARKAIQKAGEDTNHIVISHYHYDHHFLPDFSGFDARALLKNSSLWMKDPNKWINESQWNRSRTFLKSICEIFEGDSFDSLEKEPEKESFSDPVPNLKHAMKKDFGDYQERRIELLDKWSRRFERWKNSWKSKNWVKEPSLSIPIQFADGKEVKVEDTKIEFSEPIYHGIEYAQTGWVIATKITDASGYVFLHTSDIQGPTIEDYADWIIDIDPDYLILDGPATYLYGYMLNKTNLRRAVDNATRILREASIDILIYDHHLLREKKYKERTKKFWKSKDDVDTLVSTAAELKGQIPKILQDTKCE